jgi:hypothetical protein
MPLLVGDGENFNVICGDPVDDGEGKQGHMIFAEAVSIGGPALRRELYGAERVF